MRPPDPRQDRPAVAPVPELFPEIELEPAFSWAGTFSETPDGLPFVGGHPDYPNAYFALCYGGNGTTFGMVAMELAREACLGRPHDDDRLFAFPSKRH